MTVIATHEYVPVKGYWSLSTCTVELPAVKATAQKITFTSSVAKQKDQQTLEKSTYA